MKKLQYMTPRMHEEQFEANEYVAACWQIACSRGQNGGQVEGNPRDGISHGMSTDGKKTGCGYTENQVIRQNADGSYSLTEVNTDNLGSLVITITDANWNAKTLDHNPAGEVVYWTTTSGNRTWHHYGTASADQTNHS